MTTNNLTALGMDLEWEDRVAFPAYPVSAVVIATALDNEGHKVQAVITTKGMTTAEAAGLVTYADEWLRYNLRADFFEAANTEDEPA